MSMPNQPRQVKGVVRPQNEDAMDAVARKTAIDSLKEFGSVLKDRSTPDGAVIEVDLGRGGSLVTDAIILHLRLFAEVRNVYLDQTDVTDDIMELLRFCPNLQKLNIADTRITDKGLEMLRYGRSLESLTIGFENPECASYITDRGFENVAHATKLNDLALSRTLVTDKGLACLRALEKLATLTLSPRQVSPHSIALLASLPRLKTITLTRGYPPGQPPGTILEDVEPAVGQLRNALPSIEVTY